MNWLWPPRQCSASRRPSLSYSRSSRMRSRTSPPGSGEWAHLEPWPGPSSFPLPAASFRLSPFLSSTLTCPGLQGAAAGQEAGIAGSAAGAAGGAVQPGQAAGPAGAAAGQAGAAGPWRAPTRAAPAGRPPVHVVLGELPTPPATASPASLPGALLIFALPLPKPGHPLTSVPGLRSRSEKGDGRPPWRSSRATSQASSAPSSR